MNKILTSAVVALSLIGAAGAADAATLYAHGPRGGVVVHASDRDGPRGHVWVRGERFVPGGIRFVAVDNWRAYGLVRPAFGAHWVRVGPEFLLISNRTGRILDVVPR